MVNGLLVKLGLRVAPWMVHKYLPKWLRGSPRGDQRWSTFLGNHARSIISCDFFLVVTVTFRALHVVVVIRHRSRRLIHFNVAAHPTAVAGGQFPRQFGDEKRVVLQQDQRRGYLKIVLHADHRALWC